MRGDPKNLQKLAALDDDRLLEEVKGRGDIPAHVAIIMDGNGRWAKRRFLPRIAGHRAGRHSVRRCLQACRKLGVGNLTLYTFSQENFKRPQSEVKALWLFLQETLLAEVEDLNRQGIRVVASGALDQLPDKARAALERAIVFLAENKNLTLNLALAYGGRQEVIHAALVLARRLAAGEITEEQVDEDEFRRGLYTPDLPDPDLVIRTSGEARLSNFLIWQTAYSEILITPVLWPDFQERDLMLAVADFQNRERRFGALPEFGASELGQDRTSLSAPGGWRRLLKVIP
ncbi:MAG: di-trans,poly-cis-decaprenylcistransferase [Gemmatimonadales bacterium]|nr:di-trans,poly-cis-decaprenylcistransferase [Gemmatimonadales bacterium]